MRRASLQRVHIPIVVYGKAFVDLFKSVTLPNLLTLASELPLDLRRASKVRIITTGRDLDAVADSSLWNRLRRMMPVEFVDGVSMRQVGEFGGYSPMVTAQARAVEEASHESAGIIFLPPDLLYSRGTFAAIVTQANRGKRIVIAPSFRVRQEDVLSEIKARKDDEGGLSLSSEEISKLIFAYWHPINDGFLWNQPTSYFWKAYANYRIGPEEILVRFFQGPTIFAWPLKPISSYRGWIDHGLIGRCVRWPWQIYVVTDCRESHSLDLTAAERRDGLTEVSNPGLYLWRQLLDIDHMTAFNIMYGFPSCRVHAGQPSSTPLERGRRTFARNVIPILIVGLAVRPILLAYRFYEHARDWTRLRLRRLGG